MNHKFFEAKGWLTKTGSQPCPPEQDGGAARRGVGKVEPGLEKILGVGLNFKSCAHSRLDVGLEKLRSLCEAYVKSIKRDHRKIDMIKKASTVHMRSIN